MVVTSPPVCIVGTTRPETGKPDETLSDPTFTPSLLLNSRNETHPFLSANINTAMPLCSCIRVERGYASPPATHSYVASGTIIACPCFPFALCAL